MSQSNVRRVGCLMPFRSGASNDSLDATNSGSTQSTAAHPPRAVARSIDVVASAFEGAEPCLRHAEALSAVAGGLDDEARILELELQDLADGRLIIDHEDFRRYEDGAWLAIRPGRCLPNHS